MLLEVYGGYPEKTTEIYIRLSFFIALISCWFIMVTARKFRSYITPSARTNLESEIDIFDFKMMVKSGLGFLILKYKPL